MTQKDKVKELVGRGLNSYHTKSLQQMDRIEKKNKEQNHKISILTNELDNDYLTKTEEGSVVSLEHSKEGMVYLDELQGNTLVNYCTDGSKEMTLNGDIDVEGISVTTTEGVDNGKVDVYCEGNTLVNIFPTNVDLTNPNSNVAESLNYFSRIFPLLQNGKTYTAMFINSPTTIYQVYISACGIPWTNITNNKAVFTVNYESFDSSVPRNLQFMSTGITPIDELTNFKIIILEGDWTDREIPPYFEGMKSVGQDDENGHKIEILSKNKNLFNPEEVYESGYSYGVPFVDSVKCQEEDGVFTIVTPENSWNRGIGFHVKTEKNKDYTLSVGEYFNDGVNMDIRCIGVYKSEYPFKSNNNIQSYVNRIVYKGLDSNNNSLTYNSKDYDYILFYIGGKWDENANGVKTFKISKIEVNQSSTKPTNYTKQNLNKKEILLNEPLRGLPNGVKDRFVKIGGEMFIERNRGIREYQEGDLELTDVITDMTNTEYSLETPIYEPLEIEPTLNAYNDITHISNNSLIPCNMKIQNSGYNVIIKPSTLYTVALDTNKSGTIGMNLGGVNGTTTNNVLTLTTPATLTDDSLRLYGKGIKGSKVRLLEGDKTNWIPSFFEGMKSSFEDKFDATDNTYKMEILSSNKNMFNKIDAMKPSNWLIGTYHSFKMQLKPNTRYSVSVNYRTDKPRWMGIFEKPYNYDGMLWAQIWDNGANNFYKSKFTTPKDGVCYLSVYSEPNTIEDRKLLFNEVYNDLTIQEEIFGDEPIIQNSNKIQFSSIEPLRSVGNTKDKFVFKNNKLMIERNIGEIIIKDTILSTSKSSDTNRTYTTRFALDKKLFPNIKLQTGDAFKSDRFKHTSWSLDVEGFGIGSNLDFNILNIRLSSLDVKGLAEWFKNNPTKFAYRLAEPTYEEIPFELQKIILEGYENGTLFFDTNIPPTSTTTYAGETPIVKSVKLNKTEVLNNTNDINDNIIPYLMDMDYRVVCLQLQSEEFNGGVAMARLFGGAYEMLKRDIQSKRYSTEEYRHRLDAYLGANKITHEEYNKLGDMLNE